MKGLKHFTDDWPAPKIRGVANALENAAGDILDFLRLLEPNEPISMPGKSGFGGLEESDHLEGGD